MNLIEIGDYIFDVEKILYVLKYTGQIDIYFAKNDKINLIGKDGDDFLEYLREHESARKLADVLKLQRA
jgi:hypothetical protein